MEFRTPGAEKLIGMKVKDKKHYVLGTIVEIAVDQEYYEKVEVAVLDNGDRIPTRSFM